jgi:hypothetical protein
MKKILLMTLALVFGFLLASAAWYYTKVKTGKSHTTVHVATSNKLIGVLHQQKTPLLAYARKHGYNTSTCFLIDMNIASGKNRFFVYSLQKDAILDAGLVAHGCCNKNWLNGRQYGNAVGCGCTSLGRYKIGYPYKGRFGNSYKLYGLDSSNNNAFKRYVVLHPYQGVPDKEVHPYPICQSDGCPMVSPAFMNKLATIINASHEPVLLQIFDSSIQ